MYHSSATLLLDGSVLVSGSNPNADCEYLALFGKFDAGVTHIDHCIVAPDVDKTTNPSYTYVTQYQVEIFYPD
jgi:hypothetical protein